MPAVAWALFGVASIVTAAAFARLVWAKGFQRVRLQAGPVSMDLSAIERNVRETRDELKPNGGSSTRDAINRIESTVADLSRRLIALEDHVTQPPRSHP